MARRVNPRPCDVCGCLISNNGTSVRHSICPECGARCQGEGQKRAYGTTPPPRQPTSVSASVDDLSEIARAIRQAIAKGATSRLALADEFDVAPRRVDEALAELSAAGYKVAVHDTDGAPARLFIEKSAGVQKSIRIDAAKHFDGYRFDFGAVSDTHLGSKYYRPEVLEAIYDNFERHGIRHVFHGGNYIEGEKPHNRFDIVAHGMSGQVDYFAKHYPRRESITTYFVAGDDHEGWYQQREGIDIGEYTQGRAEAMGRRDLVNLGYMESDVAVTIPGGKKITIRVMHAGGGSAYALSYAPQKIVESLEGGEKPQILLIGHYHKAEYLFYRNVHVLQLGTTKAQDTFMRKLRLAAHVGGWRCSVLINRDGAIAEFTCTLLPFFNRSYYESAEIDVESNIAALRSPNQTYNVVR